MSQTFERVVDRKNAIIQSLAKDLEEAEEQYQVALRSHLQKVDDLMGTVKFISTKGMKSSQKSCIGHGRNCQSMISIVISLLDFQAKRIKDLDDGYKQQLETLRREFDTER